MKHLESLTGKFPKSGLSLEPEVRALYNEYMKIWSEDDLGMIAIPEEQVNEYFTHIQDEFDLMDGELPVTYLIEWVTVVNKIEKSLMEAKGAKHAKLRYTLMENEPSKLFNTAYQAKVVSKSVKRDYIKKYEKLLSIWTNTVEL